MEEIEGPKGSEDAPAAGCGMLMQFGSVYTCYPIVSSSRKSKNLLPSRFPLHPMPT